MLGFSYEQQANNSGIGKIIILLITLEMPQLHQFYASLLNESIHFFNGYNDLKDFEQ